MYEETLKRKPLRGLGTFLSIIILVFSILALMLLVGWVQILWGIGYLQYILLAGVLTTLLLLLRRQITRYVYVIQGDEVRILRRIGEKQKILYAFQAGDIEQFGKIPQVSLSGKHRRLFLFDYTEEDAFFIVLSRNALAMNPSVLFVDKLKEVYEKTHC